MSARRLSFALLSRLGGVGLAVLVALALLLLPPPALRLGGAGQAAVLVQGSAVATPQRTAAVKVPKAEPEAAPPLALTEAPPNPGPFWSASRLAALPLPQDRAQRRVPGQGARAPPVFSDRSV
jgi:hypothetical protein